MNAPVIFQYLKALDNHDASDLYLTVGVEPMARAGGTLIPLTPERQTVEDIQNILNTILTTRQKRDFESHQELNLALDIGKSGRYRVNVLRQRQMPALVIRRITTEIPSFKDLHLPDLMATLSMERRGLILLTGMTGSGKSTTLASMIDHRNMTEQGHIITIEDPVEYFHEHKQCIISQREVGIDTDSYYVAMKNAMRQRPDIIMVGEIRDREVMEQALTIAETGHLCLATIHTNNSYQAIERIVNLFPEEFHNQVRLNLSLNLRAIISQRLLPRIGGGLIPALEVMLNQGLIRELVQGGNISKIKDVIEQNTSLGMCSFDQSLMKLYIDGEITRDTAINQSERASDMEIKLREVEMKRESTNENVDSFREMDTSFISLSDS